MTRYQTIINKIESVNFQTKDSEKYTFLMLPLVNLTSRIENVKAKVIGSNRLDDLVDDELHVFNNKNDLIKYSKLFDVNSSQLFDFLSGFESYSLNDVKIYINQTLTPLLRKELVKQYGNREEFEITKDHIDFLFGNFNKLKNYSVNIKTNNLEEDIEDYLISINQAFNDVISNVESLIQDKNYQNAKCIAIDIQNYLSIDKISSSNYFQTFNIKEYKRKLFSTTPKNKAIKDSDKDCLVELEKLKKQKIEFEKSFLAISTKLYEDMYDDNEVMSSSLNEILLLCAIYTACPSYMLNSYMFNVSYVDFRNMIAEHSVQDSSVSNLLMKSTQQANRWRTMNKPTEHTQKLINVLYHHFSQFREDHGRFRYELIAWKKLVNRISEKQVYKTFKKSK